MVSVKISVNRERTLGTNEADTENTWQQNHSQKYGVKNFCIYINTVTYLPWKCMLLTLTKKSERVRQTRKMYQTETSKITFNPKIFCEVSISKKSIQNIRNYTCACILTSSSMTILT